VTCIPAEEYPDIVGTMRRKRSETKEEFKRKVEEYMTGREEKARLSANRAELKLQKQQEARDAKIQPGTRESLLTLFGVTAERLEELREHADTNEYPRMVPQRLKPVTTRSAFHDDGYAMERSVLYEWVQETFVVKSSEAICDLDCYNCPTAQMLACISNNLTPMVDGGAHLESTIFPAPRENHT
jgi:hypothetical protein